MCQREYREDIEDPEHFVHMTFDGSLNEKSLTNAIGFAFERGWNPDKVQLHSQHKSILETFADFSDGRYGSEFGFVKVFWNDTLRANVIAVGEGKSLQDKLDEAVDAVIKDLTWWRKQPKEYRMCWRPRFFEPESVLQSARENGHVDGVR